MNRNSERHFLNVPNLNVSRTRFKRDQNILTTFDSGKLIPFFVDEVLPGDTFSVDTSAIIRMTTPKYPVMDDAYIDFYYFYCPNRILWDNFKHFMGEVEDKPWEPTKTYKVPEIVISNSGGSKELPKEECILDYMGVPTKIKNSFRVNALPVRAYVMIWNEFFRDQNIENAAVFTRDDKDVIYADSNGIDETLKNAITGGRCLPVSKLHDYFTSCLPYPQRGPEISVPLNGDAPVVMGSIVNGKVKPFESTYKIWLNGPGAGGGQIFNRSYSGIPTVAELGGVDSSGATPDPEGNNIITGQLYTNLATVQATTINELRNAIAVQQYYEAMARGGSRYREQLQALWNVNISDKTVQIPEYLGGGRYHVNMNQIVQTSASTPNDFSPLGETGAMSVTPINESSFTKSFEEHGFVIGVMCVRHDRTYQQGLERFWSRKDKLDYYVPQFANLGEQPVKKKEIMLTGTEKDEETFGFQEAWAEYRMKPNRVSGLMRSNSTGTLDFWHYADNYETVPTLSQEWIQEGKEEIARTLIVQNEPQFFGAIRVSNNTTRCMPLYSVPGLNRL